MKKGQNAVEFVVLSSLMILVFLIFFIIVQQKTAQINSDRYNTAAQQVMNLAISEIRTALGVTDNYYREFTLPNNIEGIDYNITIMTGVGNSTELVIFYNNKEKVYFLEAYMNSTSTIKSGLNSISKNNGVLMIKALS